MKQDSKDILQQPPEDKGIRLLAKKLAGKLEAKDESRKKKLGIFYVLCRIAAYAVDTTGQYEYPSMSRLLDMKNPGPDRLESKIDRYYIARYIRRLVRQDSVKIVKQDGREVLIVTKHGREKILKKAIEELTVVKPRRWDSTWWLVSYDLPGKYSAYRHLIRKRFLKWGFYPLHKSVYLHAYPCRDEVDYLREYFGLGEFIRIFKVASIEFDHLYKKFFKLV